MPTTQERPLRPGLDLGHRAAGPAAEEVPPGDADVPAVGGVG